MSGKTFYFYTTEHIERVVNVFDFVTSGDWRGLTDDRPHSSSLKFQYYKFVLAEQSTRDEILPLPFDEKHRILFGVVQMNCRKTSESITSYFARNFGIFKIVFSRAVSPIILPHLKIQYALNSMAQYPDVWNVVDFKESGNFEFGGGHRNVKSEISTYFLLFENQEYFEACMRGRDKLAVIKMNEFSDSVDNCISIEQIKKYYIM